MLLFPLCNFGWCCPAVPYFGQHLKILTGGSGHSHGASHAWSSGSPGTALFQWLWHCDRLSRWARWARWTRRSRFSLQSREATGSRPTRFACGSLESGNMCVGMFIIFSVFIILLCGSYPGSSLSSRSSGSNRAVLTRFSYLTSWAPVNDVNIEVRKSVKSE